MFGWLKYLALIALLSVVLASCTPKHSTQPLLKDGFIIQTVYIDEAFTFEEYLHIKSAADEWQYTSRGIVKYDLIYPYRPTDNTLTVSEGRNVVYKVLSNHPYVAKTDRQIVEGNRRKNITATMVTLGFESVVDRSRDLWFIGLVTDRISSMQKLRVVAIHEFGHALNMKHRDNELGIMNASASFQTGGCLNRYDTLQFAEVYGYDIQIMNYCP